MGHTTSRCYLPSLDFKGDVAYVLGRTTGDEGQLCGDVDGNGQDQNKIQKWSLYKPVRLNKLGILTEADFKSVNYGYEINSYQYLRTQGASQGAVDAWLAGTIWAYLKPRGKTTYNEWYRITDFDQYDSGSLCPFQVTYNNEPTIGKSAQYNCEFVANIVDWAAWSSFGPSYTTLYLVLVKTGGTQGTQIYPISSSQTNSFLDIIAGSDKMNYQVSSSAFTAGTTYSIFPCLTTYNAGSNVNTWITLNESSGTLGTWWPLPAPSSSVVPKSSATPSDLTNVTIVDFEFVSYDQVNNTSTIKDVQYYIKNNNTTALQTVTVQAFYEIGGTKTLIGSATSLGNIAANETKTGTLVTSNFTFTNNTPLQAKIGIRVISSTPSFTKENAMTKNAEKE